MAKICDITMAYRCVPRGGGSNEPPFFGVHTTRPVKVLHVHVRVDILEVLFIIQGPRMHLYEWMCMY